MNATQHAAELETTHENVRRAVATWDTCDIAVLIKDGTNVGPIRDGLTVENINDFDAAPYTLFEFNVA